MSKKYKIEVTTSFDFHYYFESNPERIRKIENFLGFHTVTTLEEYFKLLNTVARLTGSNYQIYCDGCYIDMLFVK